MGFNKKEIERICKEPEFMARFTILEDRLNDIRNFLGINLIVLSIVCFALLIIFIEVF